jgi:hypothetical protein
MQNHSSSNIVLDQCFSNTERCCYTTDGNQIVAACMSDAR